jgi:hypothetical protein
MKITREITRMLFCLLSGLSFAAPVTVLDAVDFGIAADGKTDDGPALRRLLSEANRADGPVTIQFPNRKTVYVGSGEERYAFRLDRMRNLTIDGGGSTFLVQQDLRFLHATVCSNLTVKSLQVDVATSPVAEATVLSVPDSRTLKVRLDCPEQAAALGGPTLEDGEQGFFGMLWLPGRYAMESEHVFIEEIVSAPESGVVNVRSPEALPPAVSRRIVPGKTRISLPVAGIAHRYGPSAMCRIDRCTDVDFRDVEIWSAPWFAFQIFRNDGDLAFRRVHIRPQPGSGRTTSSWRDGFHVKGNKGSLLFDGCILEGMNDDAFNVSSHAWMVEECPAPNRIRIRQILPIQVMPPQAGGTLFALSPDGSRRLESARILQVNGMTGDEAVFLPGHVRPPELLLELDKPVSGMQPGCVVWDESTSNPDVKIRNCVIKNSCRFQSPVTVEGCDVYALMWFYGNEVEGPLPSGSVVRGCTLRQGRGNPKYAVSVIGWRDLKEPDALPAKEEFPLQGFHFEKNRVSGRLLLNGVSGIELKNNRFDEGEYAIEIENSPQE